MIYNDLDLQVLLDEKPYDIDTAIYYADELTAKYKHIYCVVKDNNLSKIKHNYSIIGFDHYRENMPVYVCFYITKLNSEKYAEEQI